MVNDISRADIGFDVDANEVTILTAAAMQTATAADRRAARRRAPRRRTIAEAILDAVERLRERALK